LVFAKLATLKNVAMVNVINVFILFVFNWFDNRTILELILLQG